MSFVIWGALLITTVALIGIPLRLIARPELTPLTLSRLTAFLLWTAGLLSGVMTLVILTAALWGMDTRIPWGLGIYMYLVPALSLPAFLLLRISSLSNLSRVFWFLTVVCGFAWYFGNQADRHFSKLPPISDPGERLGMFLNAFTILFVMISVLIQLASVCRRRQQKQLEATGHANSL